MKKWKQKDWARVVVPVPTAGPYALLILLRLEKSTLTTLEKLVVGRVEVPSTCCNRKESESTRSRMDNISRTLWPSC
jgi:hypothetical protein